MPDLGSLVVCSFCGTSKQQAKVMIGVPHVYICDECVSRVHEVTAEPGGTVSTPRHTIQQVPEEAWEQQCCFCRKCRHQVAAMAEAGDARICDQCLSLCDEVLSEVPPLPSR